jgi:hypothetical protein
MADSDESYDFSDLGPFLTKLREGYDLVMGNRFKGRIKPGAMPWKNRYIGNPVLSTIGKIFFHCPASDFHCGTRGYSKDAFTRMDLCTTGMEFASEMVIKATMMRMKIASGGTFPMRATPGSGESGIYGRPAGCSRIHAVDSTVFPSVAATTIALTAMANAYRIGSTLANYS